MMSRYSGFVRRFTAAAALLALAACGGSGDEDGRTAQMRSGGSGGGPPGGGPPGGAERAIPVAAETAGPRPVEVTLRASANLRAREEVDVLPKQQGVVARILAEEGDRVSAGDVLAEMDDEEWRLEARRVEAQARAAREAVERGRALQEQGLLSDQEVESLESDASVAQSDVALAELRVRNARITAPVDGVVTHRHIERGQLLSTAEPAFTVVDDRTLEARVGIPERQAGRVSPGQSVRVRADEGGGDPARGEVVRVRPVVDVESGTVQVTVQLDPSSSADLRPGRFVNVDIVTESLPDRITVPRTAVVADGQVPRVFVIRGEQARAVDVELGYSQGDRVEVRSGLEPGDTVVVVGQANLRDQVPVRLMELDGAVVEGEGMPGGEEEPPAEGEFPGEVPGEVDGEGERPGPVDRERPGGPSAAAERDGDGDAGPGTLGPDDGR